MRPARRFVVGYVSRFALGAGLVSVAIVVAVAVAAAPLLLALVPVEVFIALRFARLGTYVSDRDLILRDVFWTKKVELAEIRHIPSTRSNRLARVSRIGRA